MVELEGAICLLTSLRRNLRLAMIHSECVIPYIYEGSRRFRVGTVARSEIDHRRICREAGCFVSMHEAEEFVTCAQMVII